MASLNDRIRRLEAERAAQVQATPAPRRRRDLELFLMRLENHVAENAGVDPSNEIPDSEPDQIIGAWDTHDYLAKCWRQASPDAVLGPDEQDFLRDMREELEAADARLRQREQKRG